MPQSRICHLFVSSFNGESRLFKELATAEALFSAETLLSIGIDKGDSKTAGRLLDRYPYERIRLRTAKLPKRLPFQLVKYAEWTVRAAWRARASGAVILHCHSLAALPATVLAGLFSRSRRVLYDAHEFEARRANTSKGRQRMMAALERLLIGFVDEVMVVSPSIRDHYKKNYPGKTILLLMNMPSTRNIDPGVDLRSNLGIPARDKVLLYVGGLSRMRGIELLLAAVKTLEGWHCVFLGAGVLESTIEEAAQSNPRIHHHPPVAERDVVGTVGMADLSYSVIDCSAKSYRFALPNKFFQSLTAGVPVLVNSQNIDMLSVGAQTGMVFGVDYDVEAIRRFIETFPERSVLREPQDFSWESQEHVLISAYRRLLDQSGPLEEEHSSETGTER